MVEAVWRPCPIKIAGTGATRRAATTANSAMMTAAAAARAGPPMRAATEPGAAAAANAGPSATMADSAARAISRYSDLRVPNHGIAARLKNSAPTMAPTVFAAYTRPTTRPPSAAPRTTAPIASGKLAPQSSAAGRIAQKQRARSVWKRYHAPPPIEGLIGQYGSDAVRFHAVQAMAATSSSCAYPRARTGSLVRRSMPDPTPLPTEMPHRNTPRMIEKVYVVAPISSVKSRVQTTSAPSAVIPDRPMIR